MFWWFERNGSYLCCEVLESTPGAFELRVLRDGSEHIERFEDPEALTAREHQVLRELDAEGWKGPYSWRL